MICRSIGEFDWDAVKCTIPSQSLIADRERLRLPTAYCFAGVMHDCAQ